MNLLFLEAISHPTLLVSPREELNAIYSSCCLTRRDFGHSHRKQWTDSACLTHTLKRGVQRTASVGVKGLLVCFVKHSGLF